MFSKKGELHTLETIMVVFVLVVIIILGLLLFYRFSLAGIQQDYQDNQDLRFKALMATVPDVGEIKCSQNGVSEECIDLYKVISVSTLYKVDPNYKNYLVEKYGFMEINLELIYPYQNETLCSAAVLEECGKWSIYSHKPAQQTFVSIKRAPISVYFPDKDSYGLAILELKRYDL